MVHISYFWLRTARKNTMVEWYFYNFTKLFLKNINKNIIYCDSNNWEWQTFCNLYFFRSFSSHMFLLQAFRLSDIEKFIDRRETKATDLDSSIVGQHVQPLKNNYFKPSIWMVFFLWFEITKTFHDTKIHLVPGDGHCLIYSWELLSWILRKCSWAMLCFMQSNQYGIPEEHKWIYQLPY